MNSRREFDQLMGQATLTDGEVVRFKELVAKHQLSLARKTAVVFGVCAIITLIALVFAFVTKSESKTSMEKAVYNAQMAAEANARIADLNAEIKATRALAEAAREEAERLLRVSQEKSKGTNSK